MQEPVVDINGTKHWYLDGKLHREDGPAIEYVIGHKEWWLNDRLHREDGPAIKCVNGSEFWYLNGSYHREDGPAVISASGHKEYWLNGKEVTISDIFPILVLGFWRIKVKKSEEIEFDIGIIT